jgi:hypothetical protein
MASDFAVVPESCCGRLDNKRGAKGSRITTGPCWALNSPCVHSPLGLQGRRYSRNEPLTRFISQQPVRKDPVWTGSTGNN